MCSDYEQAIIRLLNIRVFPSFFYEMPSTKWPKHRTCYNIKESERIALFFLSFRLNTEIRGYLRTPAAFVLQYPYLKSLGVPQSRSKYRTDRKKSLPPPAVEESSIPQKIFLPVPTELIRTVKYSEGNVKSILTTKHTCIQAVFPCSLGASFL